jgi:predicted secreted protein
MKHTAVEWLVNEIKFARNLCDDPSAEMDIWHTLDVLIAKGEEAKAMEKEQMMYAYNSDRDLLSCYDDGSAFNEYYNETYL